MRYFLALLLPLALAACDQAPAKVSPPPPPAVTAAKPLVKELVEFDDFTGRFEAVASVEVRARVSGYLESVHFKDGQIVKEGDLLFVIDPKPYEVSLRRSQAELTRAQTHLDLATRELDRAQRLAQTGTGTERNLDVQRQSRGEAAANIEAAQAQIAADRLNLGYTKITAPIAGRISRKLVTEGNLVLTNETVLTTIVSIDPVYFYFDVDERSYLAYVRMALDGTRPSGRTSQYPVEIALADEKEFRHQGKMDFVDSRIDASTGTMRGRALVENKDQLIAPGLFGRIRIPGSNKYPAVLIPDEAIAADLDRRVVYVLGEGGAVSERAIRPGPRIDGYRVVRQGLKGDETLVISGLQRIQFGASKVTPQLVTLPPTR
jgi:membrane fusion protein, multidrug efflux system